MENQGSNNLHGMTNQDSVRRIKEKKKLDVKGVQDEVSDLMESSLVKIEQEMDSQQRKSVISSLQAHTFFSNLNYQELELVATGMFYCSVEANEFVFRQKDSASCFFVLSKGSIEVIIDGSVKRV